MHRRKSHAAEVKAAQVEEFRQRIRVMLWWQLMFMRWDFAGFVAKDMNSLF